MIRKAEEYAKEYCDKNIPSFPLLHLAISSAYEAGWDEAMDMWVDVKVCPPPTGEYVIALCSKGDGTKVYPCIYKQSENEETDKTIVSWSHIPKHKKHEIEK